MANNVTGRQFILNTVGLVAGTGYNFKVAGGTWQAPGAVGATFQFNDAAGRVYTYTAYQVDYPIDLGKLGWIEGPITITSLPSGVVYMYLDK